MKFLSTLKSSGVTPLKGSNAQDPSGTLAGRGVGQHSKQ